MRANQQPRTTAAVTNGPGATAAAVQPADESTTEPVIPLFKPHMPESVLDPVAETLMSGYIGQGPKVDEFERQLAPVVGSRQVLTLNSCTSAIHLALRLANVGPGDEVISTPMTCTATNEPVVERGARLVWADIDPKTANIDPRSVEQKITPRTKAIIVVHWGGNPCDLTQLNDIGRAHGIPVIEDAAHAFGSEYKDRPIGSHSDFVCFSFQAIKHITTVDGGALVCRDPEAYRRGKLLRWYGIDRETPRTDFRCEEDVVEHGYKFHMNDVAAAIGIEQLKYIDGIVKAHQENATWYAERFRDLSGVELLHHKDDRRSAHWLFTMLVRDRDAFMHHMQDAGITVSRVHARNDGHTMFREFRAELPGVDEFDAQQVSIPVGWWLTKNDRARVADAVEQFFS